MNNNIKKITICSLFAAMIFVVTRLCMPVGTVGYIHLGDAIIYLAAVLLDTPYAIVASMIGAGLSDLTAGYAIYIIPTIIIKALVVLSIKGLLKLSKNSIVSDLLCCLSGIVTVIGYYIAEVILILLASNGGINAALTGAIATLPVNAVQALASAVLFMILSTIVRQTKLIKYLEK